MYEELMLHALRCQRSSMTKEQFDMWSENEAKKMKIRQLQDEILTLKKDIKIKELERELDELKAKARKEDQI